MVGKHISFSKKTIRDTPLSGKTVLVRADYNVPLLEDGTIGDDFRIVSSLPTLKYLINQQCKIVICSHLGRPDGKVNPAESMEVVAKRLQELLDRPVDFVNESIGDRVIQASKRLRPGHVLLLENLRFHAGEEANDPAFAETLAQNSGASYFVQDGFGVVHRAHASTSAITQYLPSVAGLLLEKECTIINTVMSHPERPMVAILGGAKISDKIGVIEKFVAIADTVVIGGAMANTFLKYKGYEIGKSLHEDGLGNVMDRIYNAANKKTDTVEDFIILPTDVAVAQSLDKTERRSVVAIADVQPSEYILN